MSLGRDERTKHVEVDISEITFKEYHGILFGKDQFIKRIFHLSGDLMEWVEESMINPDINPISILFDYTTMHAHIYEGENNA